MKNCQSKISLATCHYCQSSWQFSQSSSPKPPLDHLTPGPNSRDSLGPAEWYRVVKHLHIDIVYNPSTFFSSSSSPPPIPKKKMKSHQMREGPLSNSSNTVPWVKVPHKKTSKTNVRECFFRYSLWLFISDLEAPATTQCPSDATQERAPLPYCFNRNSSWGSWKRAWRSKTHLTRMIQNQDVLRHCHQNMVP